MTLRSGKIHEADVVLGSTEERSVCREALLGRAFNLMYLFGMSCDCLGAELHICNVCRLSFFYKKRNIAVAPLAEKPDHVKALLSSPFGGQRLGIVRRPLKMAVFFP